MVLIKSIKYVDEILCQARKKRKPMHIHHTRILVDEDESLITCENYIYALEKIMYLTLKNDKFKVYFNHNLLAKEESLEILNNDQARLKTSF